MRPDTLNAMSPRRRWWVAAALLAAMVLGQGRAGTAFAQPDPSGRESYWFGLLSKGPEWSPARTPRTERLQKQHLANIHRMWQLGSLVAAGPFEDDGDLRGVFVFRADSIELVERLSQVDPTIASGRLKLDLFEWWAPRGIGAKYRERASRNPAPKDSMVVVQIAFLKRPAEPPFKPARELARLNQAHEENIERLLDSGKMPVAGPFTGGGAYRGVCVFTTGADEARRLIASDPLVQAGQLEVELHPWWVADGVLDVTAAKEAPARAAAGRTEPRERPKPPAPRGDAPAFGEYVYVEELPEAITRPAPIYPDAARRDGVEGTVMIQVLVLKDGSVSECRIIKSVPGLDEAAVAAVRQWRFKPAMAKGAPVAVWVAVPIKLGP